MARTGDGLSPVDPRFGVAGALATTAYSRCVAVAGAALDGILRDPQLANERLVGLYSLVHGIEDSFSAAHVERDGALKIVHLLSWTLIDWARYVLRGRTGFPAPTHHGVTDERDHDYVRRRFRAEDGRDCADFHNPYAFPEECLTDRARAAVDAVVDLLIAVYLIRSQAAAEGRRPSLLPPSSPEDVSLWMGFVHAHLESVAVPAEAPHEIFQKLPRPDVLVGAEAVAGPHELGLGLWGARFFTGPALPFELGLTGVAGVNRSDGRNVVLGSVGLNLMLPLVRRFAIGVTPVALRVACNTSFRSCAPDVAASLGLLIVPIGRETWVALEGPSWSWTTREVGTTWVGVGFGWSHETELDTRLPEAEAVATWDPPRPAEVHAYRETRSTRIVYFAATVDSQSDNQFAGVGLGWRWDRDGWNRRAGFAPGFQIEVNQGRIDQPDPGGCLAGAPTLWMYLKPNLLAVTATPALVRLGALAGKANGVDVAARVGVVLDIGRVEVSIDSPPLSYVEQSRWHALPLTARIGLMFD